MINTYNPAANISSCVLCVRKQKWLARNMILSSNMSHIAQIAHRTGVANFHFMSYNPEEADIMLSMGSINHSARKEPVSILGIP